MDLTRCNLGKFFVVPIFVANASIHAKTSEILAAKVGTIFQEV